MIAGGSLGITTLYLFISKIFSPLFLLLPSFSKGEREEGERDEERKSREREREREREGERGYRCISFVKSLVGVVNDR